MPLSRDEEPSGERGDPRTVDAQSTEAPYRDSPTDLAELASTLAAHGGGTASLDLALDLVLNEVVEQARWSTGAAGAAIALARGDEMVCRATTGETAPDLGTRLDTTAGLSGTCLQSGEIQRCDDTATDPRVDAELCRQLRVKSILVVPLRDGDKVYGIFEIFSPRANAFGDRDINTLQALERRVLDNRKRAQAGSAALLRYGRPGRNAENVIGAAEQEKVASVSAFSTLPSSQRSGIWTPAFGALVIAVAVLLGVIVGWQKAALGSRGKVYRRTSAHSVPAGRDPSPTLSARPAVQPANAGSNTAPAGLAAKTENSAAAVNPTPSAGGLVVSQNGKVIFRMPSTSRSIEPPRPSAIPSAQKPDESTPESKNHGTGLVTPASMAGDMSHESEDSGVSRLIHRVEPQYPDEARAQNIQGSVVLEVQIGEDGSVSNLKVVEGNPLLAEAAMQAVKQWRYQPYSVDGRPVEMQTRIAIKFTLPKS